MKNGRTLTIRRLALATVMLINLAAVYSEAAHKGLSFQAVLKKPDGTYPNVTGVNATLQILDPVTDCVLREEVHSGVNIANGYINLILGSSLAATPAGKNPAVVLTIPQVMDNATPRTGLNCVDANDNIAASNQTYTPNKNHARKLRLRVQVGADMVVADFNLRAVAYAVNSETLEGKDSTGFVQTSANITQVRAESVYSRYAILDAILNGTYAGNSATATALATAPGSCPAGQYMSAMTANGSITCSAPAGSVTNVTSANAYITVATGTSTPVLTAVVGAAANTLAAGNDARFTDSRPPNGTAGGDLSGTYPNPSVAKVAGKSVVLTTPATGDVLTYNGTNFVNSPGADATKLPLAGGTMSGAIDMGSQNLTNTGYITMSASKSLHLSNNASDPAGLVAADKGKIWFNSTSGVIKYWDGSAAQPLGVAGAGLQTFNTQSGTSQTLAIGTSGTAPAWVSATNTHTLNIPMASTAAVTAGLISKTDYDAFNTKLGTATAFSGDVSGTYNATSVDKIKGKAVTPAAYASGQTLRYNGTDWVNAVLAFADLGSKPTTLAGYGITDAQSSTLADGKIFVGNGSNVATAVTMSGDATLSNAGAITLATVPITKGGTGVTSFAGDKVITTSAAGALQATSCGLNQVISFTVGGAITCATPAGGSVTSVTSANSYLTVATGTTTPVLTLNVGAVANTVAAGNDARFTDSRAPNGAAGGDLSGTYPNPSVAKVAGKTVTLTAPASGDVLTYNGTIFVNAPPVGDSTKLPLAGGAMSGAIAMGAQNLTNTGFITMATDKNILLSNNSSDPAGLAAGDKGRMWFNSTTGVIKYWDGTTAQPLGIAGSGLQTFNGQTGSTQTLAIGTSGSAPAWSSATNAHTLNIPMASSATVTAGLLSKSDYDAFNTKLGTATTFAGDVSGTYNATSVDKIKGKAITAGAYSAGQTLRYDGTDWINSVLAFADLGSKPTTLAGYGITDAQSSTLANGKILVGNASNVATAVTMSGDATLSNAGALTLATVPITKGGTGVTSFTGDKVITTSAAGALQASSCALNQVITFTAGGAIVCADVSSLVTGFTNGGNSFGAAGNLGTNDAYALNFKTNNVTKMTILSSGNVGINNTNPSNQLHLTNDLVNGTTPNGVTVTTASASPNWYGASFNGESSGGTTSVPTASPDNSLLVQLLGKSYATDGYKTAGAITVGAEGASVWGSHPGSIRFLTTPSGSATNTERMRITAAGLVGIGTTAPAATFHVAANATGGGYTSQTKSGPALAVSKIENGNTTSDSYANLMFRTASFDSGIYNVYGGSADTGRMAFTSENFEAVSILHNGYVGIGATAPVFPFEVAGNTKLTGALYLYTAPNGGTNTIHFRDTTNGWSAGTITATKLGGGVSSGILNFTTAGATNQLVLDSTGYIGLGTASPVDPLSIGAAVPASATKALVNLSNTALVGGSANGTYIGANPAAFTGNFLEFQVAGASKFKVDNTGKIYGDGSGLTNLSGSVSGLTTGKIPKAASATTLADSLLTESGSNVSLPGSLTVAYPTTSAVIIGDTTGNARGTASVDIQAERTAVTQVAVGTNSTAIGSRNTTGGTAPTTAIGYNNSAAASFWGGAAAIGSSNTATGSGTVAVGISNNSGLWDAGVTLGFGNTIAGHMGIAMGTSNTAAASGLALGYTNTAPASGVAIGLNVNNTVASSLQIGPSNTAKITILSTGSTGIGNIAPNEKLEVSGNARLSGTSPYLSFYYPGQRHWAAGIGLNSGPGNGFVINDASNGSNPFTLEANAPTNAIYVKTAGLVGLGTSSAAAKLDVTDTGTTTSAILVPRAGNFTGTAVNGMVRYNSTSTLFEFYQNGAWVNYTTVSDGRLKTNVIPVTDGLDIVNKLNPVFYDWDRSNPKASGFEEKHQVGFIAQEVEKVLPEVVNHGEDSYRSLEYGKMVSVVVAAVKELYAKVLGHDEKIQAQTREIASLKSEKADRSEVNQLKLENAKLKADAEKQKQENAAMKARLDKIEMLLKSK